MVGWRYFLRICSPGTRGGDEAPYVSLPFPARTWIKIRSELTFMLDQVRIPATLHVADESSPEEISTICADAALVMVSTRLRRGEVLDPWERSLYSLVSELPMVAAIIAATNIDLIAGPESGAYSAIAAAEDRLAAAQDRLKRIADQVTKIDSQVAELQQNADRATSTEDEALLEAAETRQAALNRRLVKARVAYGAAEQDLAALDKGP